MRPLSIALISAVSVIALTQIAAAAPPPPPVYNWTGFYVGGNVGYSWGDANTNFAGNGTTVSFAGIPTNAITNPPFGFADSGTQRLSGVLAGGQFGYNWQFSPQWVLGFEADIQAASEPGSSAFADPFSQPACVTSLFVPPGPAVCLANATVNGTAVTSFEAEIGWFGTVRARLGYLVSDQLLVYGTGGLAYGKVSVSGNISLNGSFFFPGLGTFPFAAGGATAFSDSKTQVGFAVGGGMEGKPYWLPSNWTWKLEYLYLDLGSLDTTNPLPPAQPLGDPITGTFTTHTHFTDNIVRVGVNYQFH